MRATVPPSPIHVRKGRLLESCAIAAGLAALAHGGPALAQVAGAGEFKVGAGTISPPGPLAPPNTTQVEVTGAQSVIDWTPTDSAPTGGPIDFLPAGNTLEFYGPGQYTVLNRFIGPAAAARPVAFNGAVTSYSGSRFSTFGNEQGGNIWFYNAGGLLIGDGATFNVGSLLLTTNAIDTTGGLFGPGGAIRFRGAASTPTTAPTIEIASNAAINATIPGNPGASYVAVVAPRIVQRGIVTADGSTAYVAAEQADIRINGGLFDIDVLVGAAGGDAIVHSGVTRGPAHQQGDTDQSRIFMVAVPKNDAVSMLVSGQLGYDDAAVAQIDPDGAVVLSAGYNIIDGVIDTAPVNAVAANITVTDTIFRSDTTAHASGAFLGQPVATIPGPIGSFVPPPQLGLVQVEGDGAFIGDASATFNVGADQAVSATGALTVQATGAAGTPGAAAVNVSGGSFGALGDVSILGDGAPDAVTGDATGGSASLSVTDGGLVQTASLLVSANGAGGIGSDGIGAGTGGSASIDVIGTGSTVQAMSVNVQATGTGASLSAASGGDGAGGTAAITVQDGAALNASNFVGVDATGLGGTGGAASGDGLGGGASIGISGNGSTYTAGFTLIGANGVGGGADSPIDTVRGGNGRGGRAELRVDADQTSTILPGAVTLVATSEGGSAVGAENARGGDAAGGDIVVEVDGGAIVEADQLLAYALATGGGGTSPSGTTGRSGDTLGGTIDIGVANGSLLQIESAPSLVAYAAPMVSEITGSAAGGNISVRAASGGQIVALGQVYADASGGSLSSGLPSALQSSSGQGGDIVFAADGGTITAGSYFVVADGITASATGTGGVADGGTIDLLASNGGLIEATDTAVSSSFSASAQSGTSAGGTGATGGTIQLIADAGTIDLSALTQLTANGRTGGDTGVGGTAVPLGHGGTVLIRTVANPANSSAILFDTLSAVANGSSVAGLEGMPGLGNDLVAGNGEGGTATLDIQGGALTATQINLNADGSGGGAGPGSGIGQGGAAAFTQGGGTVDVGQLAVSANGQGGEGDGAAATGIGGVATINLNGGTLDGVAVTASATGIGGFGATGDDADPANPIAPGDGGDGEGGTATVNIDGTAVVTVASLGADATGQGQRGGDLFAIDVFTADGGAGGNGSGGTATINMLSGTLNTGDLTATAAGIGGDGGSYSSGSGIPAGIAIGGDGGDGTGGTATINLASGLNATIPPSIRATGTGGTGGNGMLGGNGGNGNGGTAQLLATGFAVGPTDIRINSTANGGDGGFGTVGDRGDGGNAAGGTARAEAAGSGATISVSQSNFVTGAVGGSGINGGNGTGGTAEISAIDSGTVTLVAVDDVDPVSFGSTGSGGMGGDGGGSGGSGGNGIGGTVRLIANGGTIGSDGHPVEIVVSGVAGGGVTPGGTTGGRAIIEALGTTGGGASAIALGDTVIRANGDNAGRVELRSGGSITMASLDAEAFGLAAPTNNDTDTAQTGIFLNTAGGSITTAGAMKLTTGGSVGVYGTGAGAVDTGADLTIGAGDQIDIRHDARTGTAPTIHAGGDLTATAANSIGGAPGSLIDADAILSLTATTGPINVDRLHGAAVTLGSAGAATVAHAESDGDFTAIVGSFTTGLNSIITGDAIVIDAPGAVNLGNSSAGSFVSVSGQSIVFNSITAGADVGLNATGTAAGAEGISGVDINANDAISLNADTIAITGTVQSGASLFAFADDGNVGIANAAVDGTVAINATGDVTGGYTAGGDIILTAGGDIDAAANALGGYVNPNGGPTEGLIFADAGGDATLTDSSAATMFGVHAGQSATVGNSVAGEDMLVLAGTTATLTDTSAGDDLTVDAAGGITATGVSTTGAGPGARTLSYGPSGSPGFNAFLIAASTASDSDIDLTSTAGNIGGGGIGAFDNLSAVAAGAVTTTGLLSSGEDTRIRGNSVSVGAISAGADIRLSAEAGDAVSTGVLTAGDDLRINAAANVDASQFDVDGDVDINADGAAVIDNGNALGRISVDAGTDITGTFNSTGDVDLTAGGNIVASAATDGGGLNSDFIPYEGRLFADAAGDVTLTNSRAATMLAVRSGGAATVTGGSAGEDLFVLAGTTATLSDVTAGDDLSVTATGAMTVDDAATTGTGADDRRVFYGPGSFNPSPILQTGASAPDLSAITLSTPGAIAASDVAAFHNLTIAAGGAVTGTGLLQSGLATSVSGAGLAVGAITAGTDIDLTAATGPIGATGAIAAGHDATLNAATDIDVAGLDAGDDVRLNAGGTLTASAATSYGTGLDDEGDGSNITLTAGGAIVIAEVVKQGDGVLNLNGTTGIEAGVLVSQGRTSLSSSDGAISVDNLTSSGEIDAAGDSIAIGATGVVNFAILTTDVGDAVLDVSGELTVAQADIAGLADFNGAGEQLAVLDLTAADARLATTGFMTLGNVAATGSLDANAVGSIFVDGMVTGTSISLGSSDIAIGADARVGMAGVTGTLNVRNNDDSRTTYIGGTGDRDGYHLDADEMTRLFGNQVTVFAPQLASNNGAFVASAPGALFVPIASIGSNAAPDVVVDDFTMTGGGAASNLGAGGTMTISTTGKMRVVGAAALTGLGDDNALTLAAGDALEVVLGEGSVRLTDGADAPAGQLNLRSDDVIVATLAAIGDVAAAGSTDAIESRLAQNDGIVSDDGALYARGIAVDVVGGFYVQNSGAGTDYGQRRGLSFGAGGLDVATEGSGTRIILNGVQLGPNGQVTGLDALPLLRVNGAAPVAGGLDARSTFNGCVILNSGACSFAANPRMDFPVQDVIEEETDPDGGQGDEITLPTALITMRGIDPMAGEPLLDDPVTGAGNDDLWSHVGDTPGENPNQTAGKGKDEGDKDGDEIDKKKGDPEKSKDALEKGKDDGDKMSRELAELLKAKMAAARKTKGGRDPDDKVLTDVLEDMLKPGPGHPPKTKAGQPDREAYEAAKRELEDTLAKLLAEQGAKVELEGLNSEERTAKLKQLVQQRSKSETERLELMKAMRLKIQDAMRAIVNNAQ